MSIPLLTTKLHIPQSRLDLVERDHLLAYLDDGLQAGRKLTLASAPAGFGKTTVISEWVHHRADRFPPCRCAWITLDASDNHPSRFISYMITALQKIHADLGREMLRVLESPQVPPLQTVLTEVLNELATLLTGDPHEHYLLVFDDYHEIIEPAVHEVVTFLLEQLPPQWHLVLATRSDPALPLARLRARGHLTEIRAADLRFTESEITAYLHHATGLELTEADIAALEARTEGWIAGLQLIALLIQDATRRQSSESPTQIISNFTGSHRYVIDYLTDEVLDRQSEALHDFLLHTSILSRLTASLCDAILDSDHSSQSMLEELEERNLFIIALDEERQWYRYHRLFTDLLQSRLRQEVGSAEVAVIHTRASAWFEQNKLISDALHHALAASDLERATELVAANALPMLRRGAIMTVQEWLNALPPEWLRAHPRLCVDQAWVLFHSHQSDGIEALVDAAELALQKPVFANSPDRTALSEHIMALRISVAEIREENATVVQLAQQALERIAAADLSARGTNLYFLGRAFGNLGQTSRGIDACLASIPCFKQVGNTLAAMGATSDLAELLRQQGELRKARMTLEDSLRWAADHDLLALPATAQLQTVLGQIYYEQNELAAAAEQLQRSIQLSRFMLPLTASCAHLGHARVQMVMGNQVVAAVALQEAEQVIAHRVIYPPEATLLVTLRIRVRLMQGDLAAVEEWIHSSGLQIDDEPVYGIEQALITLGRVLVTRGNATNSASDLRQANTLLTRLEKSVRTAGRTGHLLEVLILKALALAALANLAAALAALTEALQIAEPEGYMRLFLDEGPILQVLLTEWQRNAAVHPRREQAASDQPDHENPWDEKPGDESHYRKLADYVSRLQKAFFDQHSTTPTALPLSVPVVPKNALQKTPVQKNAQQSDHDLVEPLGQREVEVLQLMADGLTNAEIAGELTIAVSTVKTHVNRIFAKLAVRSRIQAVRRGHDLSLIP